MVRSADQIVGSLETVFIPSHEKPFARLFHSVFTVQVVLQSPFTSRHSRPGDTLQSDCCRMGIASVPVQGDSQTPEI